jgi:tetratricopeptide (TPR) repeat protein
MLMKETAVAAPAVILIIDALAVRRDSRGIFAGIGQSLRQRPGFYTLIFATIGIAVAVVWGQRQAYPELVGGSWTPLEYATTQPLALLRYLTLTFWPVGQCFDYGWRAVDPGLVAAGGVATAVASVAVAIAVSGRLPDLSLAVLVFLVLLAPTSSLLPVLDLAVEHRMYLPLSVIALAVVVLGSRLAARPLLWSPPMAGGLVLGGLLVAVLAGLAMATHQRVQVYRSLFALWDDTADKAPHNPRAHLWRGIALVEQDRQREAFAAFGRAIAIAPRAAETAKAHAWRAAILGRAGDSAGAYAEAERATKLNPREPLGWANLAQACAMLGRKEQAMLAAKQALELDPFLVPTRRLVENLQSNAQK